MIAREYNPKMFNPWEDFLNQFGEKDEYVEKEKIWNVLTYGEKSKLCEYRELNRLAKSRNLSADQTVRLLSLRRWCEEKSLGSANVPPFRD